MTSRLIALPVLLICLLLSTSCVKQIAKQLGDVLIVQAEIMKAFGEEANVRVNVFGGQTTLSVAFINSPLNDQGRIERVQRATATANIVKAHYPQSDTLAGTFVSFVRQKTTLVFFHQFYTVDTFAFDKDARPLKNFHGQSDTSPTIDLETTVNYLEHSKETDIAVTGLQLEGVSGAGLTLIPHFTVAGNANEKEAKPPAVVTFDFASYAERERFTGEVVFDFIVNGKRVLSTQGRFSEYKPPGAVAQFCYLRFPYKEFKKMVAGDALTIRIDETQYELTAEQFAALKKMSIYVKD